MLRDCLAVLYSRTCLLRHGVCIEVALCFFAQFKGNTLQPAPGAAFRSSCMQSAGSLHPLRLIPGVTSPLGSIGCDIILAGLCTCCRSYAPMGLLVLVSAPVQGFCVVPPYLSCWMDWAQCLPRAKLHIFVTLQARHQRACSLAHHSPSLLCW
jgi:hypothetical protein